MGERGADLLQRFIQYGFEGLVDDQTALLSLNSSRESAAQTGRAQLVFISDAIDVTSALVLSHDEYGGIRHGFIRRLDEIVYERLPLIQKAEAHWAAKLAKDFCDSIRAMVRDYDPRNDYE